MSKVTIQEAEFLTGMTRQAINYATKNGTLSYTHNEKGTKVIDVSELQRAGYSLVKTIEELESLRSGSKSKDVKSSKAEDVKASNDSNLELKLLQQKLESMEKLLENETKERVRERDQFEKQIDTLNDSLKSAQETASRVTLLLEDNTKREDTEDKWQASMNALEGRIANQETKATEEKERAQKILRQNQALKKQLEEEKNKSFWAKLFG